MMNKCEGCGNLIHEDMVTCPNCGVLPDDRLADIDSSGIMGFVQLLRIIGWCLSSGLMGLCMYALWHDLDKGIPFSFTGYIEVIAVGFVGVVILWITSIGAKREVHRALLLTPLAVAGYVFLLAVPNTTPCDTVYRATDLNNMDVVIQSFFLESDDGIEPSAAHVNDGEDATWIEGGRFANQYQIHWKGEHNFHYVRNPLLLSKGYMEYHASRKNGYVAYRYVPEFRIWGNGWFFGAFIGIVYALILFPMFSRPSAGSAHRGGDAD